MIRSAGRLVALLLLAGACALAACDNTIRGIGQDLKETGRAIGDSVS